LLNSARVRDRFFSILDATRKRWQVRFYDFNLWTTKKCVEKLRYMHRNPVKRGLVESPEPWRWSSDRFYLLDEAGPVRVNEGWGRISFQDGGGVRAVVKFKSCAAGNPVPALAINARAGAPTAFVTSARSKAWGTRPVNPGQRVRCHEPAQLLAS
jgi:hypothetical protein